MSAKWYLRPREPAKERVRNMSLIVRDLTLNLQAAWAVLSSTCRCIRTVVGLVEKTLLSEGTLDRVLQDE